MEKILIAKDINTDLLIQELNDQVSQAAYWLMWENGQILVIVPDGISRAAVQAVIDAHDALGQTRAGRVKSQVVQIAQSAVGVRLQDLTAAQVRALMAVLLFRAGGVDPDTLVVRPLGEWV